MATQLSDEKDHRSTCSLCFERYSATRQAKILTCFHSFCLPCLEVLAEQASKHKQTSEETNQKPLNSSNGEHEKETLHGEEGDNTQPLAFSCPTCRKTIIIPHGGVIQFQSNFYIEEDDVSPPLETSPCELCDDGSDAVYSCKDCQKNLCSKCECLHRKFKSMSDHDVQPLENILQGQTFVKPETRKIFQSQIKVVEVALACMAEEESEMEGQKQELIAEIKMLGNTLMTYVRQAQEETERTVDAAAQKIWDELNAEITKARQLHGLLNRVIRDNVITNQMHLGNEEMQYYKQRASCRGQKHVYFRKNREQTPVTIDLIRPFFGNPTLDIKVIEEDVTQEIEMGTHYCNTFLGNSKHTTEWKRNLAKMNSKMADLECEYTAQKDLILDMSQDLQSLKSLLNKELTSFQDRVTKVENNVTGQQTKLNNEIRRLQSEYSQLKDETKAVKTKNSNLQKETSQLKDNITNMQQMISSHERVINFTKTRLNTAVAFHACLSGLKRFKTNDTIINDEVVSNVGGAYNAHTGIFTAPVHGTYLFIGTAAIGEKTGKVNFNIHQDDTIVASGFSQTHKAGNDCPTTAHAVLELRPGQKVRMVASSLDEQIETHVFWHYFTHFSGVLIHVNN